MAYDALAVQKVLQTGLAPEMTAMTNSGSEFVNNGNTILLVENEAVGDAVVTIITAATFSGLALADQAVTVAGESKKVIGVFDRRYFNTNDGKVQVTTDTITTTKIAAISLT